MKVEYWKNTQVLGQKSEYVNIGVGNDSGLILILAFPVFLHCREKYGTALPGGRPGRSTLSAQGTTNGVDV